MLNVTLNTRIIIILLHFKAVQEVMLAFYKMPGSQSLTATIINERFWDPLLNVVVSLIKRSSINFAKTILQACHLRSHHLHWQKGFVWREVGEEAYCMCRELGGRKERMLVLLLIDRVAGEKTL